MPENVDNPSSSCVFYDLFVTVGSAEIELNNLRRTYTSKIKGEEQKSMQVNSLKVYNQHYSRFHSMYSFAYFVSDRFTSCFQCTVGLYS